MSDTAVQGHLQGTLREGETSLVWGLRQPNGSTRTMRTTSRVLRRFPDGAAEIVGYTLDITVEREAEARAMAAARMASLGEMGTGLAHEIKQPLQALSLAAEIACIAVRRNDSPTVVEKLDFITEQAERAAAIVEHLRRFARGVPPGTKPAPLSLAEPVEGALLLGGAMLRDIGAEVEVCLGEPPLHVIAEVTALEQVLLNLLTNARDALAGRPAGEPRRIRITARQATFGKVEITVADTGGGIAPEMLPNLFEPFMTTKSPDRGTGLGLATAYGVLRSLGGEISARNNAEGAVFTIRLPGVQPG